MFLTAIGEKFWNDFYFLLKSINNCLPTRSARKEDTSVWENPIEKKHEDQNTVNLLVLLEKNCTQK